ncbi:hypothetical protein [Trichlorobacter lovleyi]|uniref:hypothetical protein n=1 Tax=Trichlorobacter lovleyi TaxID=313985 RepID=UPI003D1117DA
MRSELKGTPKEFAINTATMFMNEAITSINGVYGEGYAESNPVLVGAFMQTAATLAVEIVAAHRPAKIR